MGRRTRETTERPSRRVGVRLPDESAPERWLRTLRFSGFTVIALGLLAIAVVILAPSLRTLIEQQQEIAALERSVAAQQAEVDGLRDELGRWSDPAYIEAQARQRLLFVYPGEMSYLVVNPAEAEPVEDGLPVSAELQTTRVDWLAALLTSSYGAGLTSASGDDLAVIGEPRGAAG